MIFLVSGVTFALAVAAALAYIGMPNRSLTGPSRPERIFTVTTIGMLVLSIGIFCIGAGIAIQNLAYEMIDVELPVQTITVDASSLTPDSSSAQILDTHIHEVTMSLANLTGGTRTLIAVGALLTYLTFSLIAFLIYKLCRRISTGRPFDTSGERLSHVTALLVLVCGTAGSIVSQLGVRQASDEVLSRATSETEGSFIDLLGEFTGDHFDIISPPGWAIEFPLWPLLVTFSIAALAVLMRMNQRLTIENAALRQDSSGLI